MLPVGQAVFFSTEDTPKIELRSVDRAALGALVGTNDTFTFQGVDDTPRPGVADPEAALHCADRGLLCCNHEARRILEQLILWFLFVLLFFVPSLYHLLYIARLGKRGTRRDDALDLRLGDKGALNTRGPESRDRLKEHITPAEKGLGAYGVQDHARVYLAGDGEGYTAGDVGFDQAGYNVHARPLGGHDEVYAHRPSLLGESCHRVLHLGRRRHHQIGKLVYDYHHEGHRLLAAVVVTL